MKTTLIALIAVTMTACTSTRSLPAPDPTSMIGIGAGDSITLVMTDGSRATGRFVAVENDELLYDVRSGERLRVVLQEVSSLSYRAYDPEKTGEAVAGTAKVTGMVLIGLAQVVGAFVGGMNY